MVEYKDYLNREELRHARDYMNQYYDRFGTTDNLGNPVKVALPFDINTIIKKRKPASIDKILTLK